MTVPVLRRANLGEIHRRIAVLPGIEDIHGPGQRDLRAPVALHDDQAPRCKHVRLEQLQEP